MGVRWPVSPEHMIRRGNAMEIHQIRYFLAVERERNFTRAAESCNITQPALTRAIQRLEEELRGPLFERRPGNVALTELGRAMLPRFEAAIATVTEAKAFARVVLSERRQRLRIGMMCTVGASTMTMIISALAEAAPEVEITLTEGRGSAVVTQLLMDEIDVAIVGQPRYVPALDVMPLYTESYGVALSREHRLANSEMIRLQDLDGECYVDRIRCEFDAYFEDSQGPWPITLDVRFRSDREDCVQALIASGVGVAVVPRSLELRSELLYRPLVEPEVSRTISLVTVRDREPPLPLVVLKKLASGLSL